MRIKILCLTSINCLFFLFSYSGNISKLFTFSKKQLQENEAIQLTIMILSLNNRTSWKCFNSRLPNTPPKFSVQRNTTCYNVVATSCRTVVTFLSSSDKREVNVRSQSRTSCFYFEYLELHNFISLPLKLETPQRRLCIRRNESSTQIKWKNSIHALICNNIRSELNYCKPLWSLGMMPNEGFYKPIRLLICKRLKTSSQTYISLAVSEFQRPWSLSNLSNRLGLLLTAEIAPPDHKLWRPYILWSKPSYLGQSS